MEHDLKVLLLEIFKMKLSLQVPLLGGTEFANTS